VKLKTLLPALLVLVLAALAGSAFAADVLGSDGATKVPQGWKTRGRTASLQVTSANTCALTTPTTATIITDADCWTAAYTDPAASAGGFTVSATNGTITVPKAMRVRVSFGLSEFTVVNSQVITVQVFAGSTAKGGVSKITQLATGDSAVDVNGVAVFDAAAGDVLSIKGIADTGNLTAGEGYFVVEEL
jgi:hypothetical protein